MFRTLLDSFSDLSVSLKSDKDGTTVAVKELPNEFEELSQASWSEIEDIFTNGPKAKAVRRLQKDLTKGWKSARKERKFELVKDLGISDDERRIEEITLISTWTQSLVGTQQEQSKIIHRCFSDSDIWTDLRGAKGIEKAVFEFDLAKKKFVCDSASDTNSIGSQMIDNQHQWWKASGGILSDFTERITEAQGRSN
ncbi:uncharacterized protein L199_002667 [Kwoniella botswanensis]|uniref:uncharacterized protein n=1 Tax=Kwoniella botswanensis TaxID=1268659 RepID=UPI00315DEB7A